MIMMFKSFIDARSTVANGSMPVASRGRSQCRSASAKHPTRLFFARRCASPRNFATSGYRCRDSKIVLRAGIGRTPDSPDRKV